MYSHPFPHHTLSELARSPRDFCTMRTETYSAACPSEGGGDIEAKQLNPEPALLEGKQPHATLDTPKLFHPHPVKKQWRIICECWGTSGTSGVFQKLGPLLPFKFSHGRTWSQRRHTTQQRIKGILHLKAEIQQAW